MPKALYMKLTSKIILHAYTFFRSVPDSRMWMRKTSKSGTDQKKNQNANLMPAMKCYLHKSDPNATHCHVNVGQGQNLNVENVKCQLAKVELSDVKQTLLHEIDLDTSSIIWRQGLLNIKVKQVVWQNSGHFQGFLLKRSIQNSHRIFWLFPSFPTLAKSYTRTLSK